MPTARELLEQADALMRRNREPQPAPADDDDIPELTEEIELAMPEVIDVPAVPSRQLHAPAAELEEIPELTDAVEEIEAPSILTLPEDEGEPSQWLDVDRGEVSITGPAPDSIAAVPPATLHADAARLRAQRIDAPVPAPSFAATPASAAAPVSAAALAASFFAGGAAAATTREPEAGPAAPVSPSDEAMIVVEIPPVAEPPDESRIVDEAPAVEEPWLVAEAAVDDAAVVVVTPPQSEVALVAEAAVDAAPAAAVTPPEPEIAIETLPVAEAASVAETGPIAPPLVAEERAVAPTVAAAAPDAVQWDALAEEIRMQVLQRIDIFTDTGMHEQLAARLQPIVDRASADLVTTINQQVGQLIRAYVAEAIEREIEKWRQGGG